MKGTNLGELEELILLTVANLKSEAYGLSIRDFIKNRCERSVSISTVHATIHRLEDKGFLSSEYDNSSATERGGRPKLVFSITSAGHAAITTARDQRNDLWNTIPSLSFNTADL